MLPLNFNHLYYFWTIGKEGSISAASRTLFLTQSSLSLQIQSFERSLRKKLFTRSRQGVSLTPAGRLTFEFAERLFSRAEEFTRVLQTDRPLPSPPLRLGVSGAISRAMVLTLLTFFQNASPENHAQISSSNADDLRDRLKRGALDVVISEMDLASGMGPEFRGKRVASLPVFFVSSPAVKATLRRFPDDMAHLPLLLRSPENPVRKEVEYFLHRHKISWTIGAETEDIEFIRSLLLAGRGVAVMDVLSIQEDLASGRLLKLHPRPLALRQDVWFVSRRRQAEPAVQQTVDTLMDSFGLRTPLSH